MDLDRHGVCWPKVEGCGPQTLQGLNPRLSEPGSGDRARRRSKCPFPPIGPCAEAVKPLTSLLSKPRTRVLSFRNTSSSQRQRETLASVPSSPTGPQS